MTIEEFQKLLGLVLVLIVAVGVLVFFLRQNSPKTKEGQMQLGYPSHLFPARHLTKNGSLAALTITQSRLLTMYQQLPAHSELSLWLRAFLEELRQIMDTAYRVAMITEVYGQPVQLDDLVAEVQQIEKEVAEHTTRCLLERDSDAQHEQLDSRLAMLRLCVKELAGLTDRGINV